MLKVRHPRQFWLGVGILGVAVGIICYELLQNRKQRDNHDYRSEEAARAALVASEAGAYPRLAEPATNYRM